MSKIVKKGFVSFTEQAREIPTIDVNNPRILGTPLNQLDSDKTHDKDEEWEGVSQTRDHEEVLEETESLNREVDSEMSAEMIEHEMNDGTMVELSPETEAFIEEAKQEGYNAGYEEGYQHGYDAGKGVGYQEGFQLGQQDAETKVQAELEAHQTANSQLQQELITEFEQYKKKLEPDMLKIIESLVLKLIGIQEVSQGTIMHLIHSGLNELEIHGDLVIKVSSFDLDYVLEHQHLLTEDLSEKITVEILRDQQLDKNECVIETDMGTIDCSLGVQMSSLMKELRLIHESLVQGD